MIFTGSYWYYGIIQFGLVAVEVLLAVFWVGRNKTFDRIAMWLIAAYLLCYKFDEYGPFSAIPLDLSAMSYFFFGMAAFVPFRPLKCAAGFSAVLSGAVYAFSMALFPENHISSISNGLSFFVINMALVNHNILIVGGLFMTAQARFERVDFVWLLAWFAFFFSYIMLVTEGFGVSVKSASIMQILDGSLVADAISVSRTPLFYVIYYTVVVAVSLTGVFLYARVNRAFNRFRRNPFLPDIIRVNPLFV